MDGEGQAFAEAVGYNTGGEPRGRSLVHCRARADVDETSCFVFEVDGASCSAVRMRTRASALPGNDLRTIEPAAAA